MSDTSFDTLSNLNTDALYDSRVSIDNFSTSNEEIAKTEKLKQAKADKLERLQNTKGKISLDDSFTQLENGNIESNRNKVWNDLSDQEFQSAFTYALDNNTLTRDAVGNVRNSDGSIYEGDTRRLYMYGSKDATNDVVKLGLSRGDEDSSDNRYVRYPSGEMGVNTDNKVLDVLLPNNVATTLEGLAHGRSKSMEGRILPDIYSDPSVRDEYGSGITEYYNSRNALFGAPQEYSQEVGRSVLEQYLNQGSDTSAEDSNFAQRVKEIEAQNTGFAGRAVNTVQGFGATFVDTLIASPVNAIGQLTGTYSLGDSEDVTKGINNFFGYNDVHVQQTMEGLKDDWEVLTSDDATLGQKLRAATSAIVDSATTPELLGTSLGTIAAWVTPAVALKALGKGAQLANNIKRVDTLLEKGKITKGMARAAKRKAFLSANGGKALAVNQSGMVWSAIGATNNQYNQFVENNNGKELEGAEKAAWFGKAMAIQVINQNLDKLVDIQAMKAGKLLPSLKATASSMTKDELANVSSTMMKTIKATAKAGGVLAGSMASEAAQEYTQTTMELYNERMGSEQFKDIESFVDFVTNDETIDEAGVAMLAGAGGAVQFNAAGKIGVGLSKAQQSAFTKEGIQKLKENAARIKDTSSKEPSLQEPLEVGEPEVSEEVQQAMEDTGITAETLEDTDSLDADELYTSYADLLTSEEEFVNTAVTEDSDKVVSPEFSENVKKSIKEKVTDNSKAITDIEKAEAIYKARELSSTDNSDKKANIVAGRVLRLAKREHLKALMEQEGTMTLGSGRTPEDIIEDLIDSSDVVDGKAVVTEEEQAIIKKFADEYKIPESRWIGLLDNRKTKLEGKDGQEVWEEALGSGNISASNRRKAIRDLVSNPNPDTKALSKAVADNDNFLVSQEVRKKAFDTALAAQQAAVVDYNKRKKDGNELDQGPTSRTAVKKGRNVKGYDKAFIAVSDDPETGGLRINPKTLAISKSIGDNIRYLKRTKNRYGKAVSKALGTEVEGTGINVRPNTTTKKVQEARERDTNWYKKTGVTKVALDEDNSSSVWSTNGDYRKDNASKVNTGDYTSDDVVLFSTKSKKQLKNSSVLSELKKAREAGATVVVERPDGSTGNMSDRILKSNHWYPAKTEEGFTRYFPTKEARDTAKVAVDEKVKVQASKKADFAALGNAIYSNDDTRVKELTDKYFKGDQEKAFAWYDRETSAQEGKLVSELIQAASINGANSAEVNDLMVDASKKATNGNLNKAAVDNAFETFNKQLESLKENTEVLTSWKDAYESSRKGEQDYNTWIKDNVPSPKGVVEDLFKNSVGNVTQYGDNREPVKYVYDKEGDKWSTISEDKITDETSYQLIELNPNTYAQVNKVTPLNSFKASDINLEGTKGIGYDRITKSAVKKFEDALKEPNLDFKSKKTGFFDIADSPAASLVFEVTDQKTMSLKINENVAVAMQLALGNLVKNNSPYLKNKRKSKKMVAEMLGKDETTVTKEMVDLVGDKGMLYKNVANSVGKDIASLLGIGRKSNNNVDAQSYDALVADLGQMAVMVGVQDGLLAVNSEVKASEYSKVLLSKVIADSSDAKVLFINIPKSKEGKAEDFGNTVKDINEDFPESDVNRKEPSLKAPSDKEIDRRLKNLNKATLDVGVASENKEAMREMMKTEWKVDLKNIRKAMEHEEDIKKALGYIEINDSSKEYANMTYSEKEVQESINSEIEKGIEELKFLADRNEGDEMSVWFDYFFSSNGRFFMDSNTINPMTNKHMHRFFVQPKNHEFQVKRDAKGKFTHVKGNKDGEDITPLVHYGIAQGFGFKTDKLGSKKISDFSEKVLKTLNTPKKVQKARVDFLKGREINNLEIGFEHYSQTLQAFNFLEELASAKKGTPITTSLTAEFDAVTSGFGLKLLQVPLLDVKQMEWMTKVGFVRSDDPVVDKLENVSMNDLLDKELGGIYDSYETLAGNMSPSSFADVLAVSESKGNKNVIVDSAYSRSVWESLYDAIPKADPVNGVSSALRSLFKPGFMTFNYSASIKTIRSNLSDEILDTLTKDMARADLSNTEDKGTNLLLAISSGDTKKAETLQGKLRTEPLYSIKMTSSKNATSLETFIKQMIDASYGVQLEGILTNAFGPFVETQETVNTAFGALFEVFAAELENKFTEARKQGPISKQKESEIYESLKDKWPAIKGPLSSMEDQYISEGGVGIYSSESAAPNGVFGGRKAPRAKVTESLGKKLSDDGQVDIRVSQMVRQLVAAVSAGSVIPIHHLDGAGIARTINTSKEKGIRGITTIHDAIMPPLVSTNEVLQSYNKSTVELGAEYSFISSLAERMLEVAEKIDWNDPVLAKATVSVRDFGTKEIKNVPLKGHFGGAKERIVNTANEVNLQRKALFDNLYATGFSVMHMAGTPEGVYTVPAGTPSPHKEIAKLSSSTYNGNPTINGVTMDNLNDSLQNICPK